MTAISAARLLQDRPALVEAAGIASLSGAIAGILVGGLAGRIAMRIAGFFSDQALVGIAVTSNGNRLGAITLGGTLALIVFGGLFTGVAGGLLYAVARPWLAPFGRLGGLVFGLALLAALGPVILEPFNIDFRKFGTPGLNVVMFALLFPLFGVAVAWATARVEERMRDPHRSPAWPALSLVALIVLALMLVLATVSTVSAVLSGAADPGQRALWLVYLLAVVVVARLVLPRVDDARRWPRLPRLVSYALLALPVLLGLPSTVDAIRFLTRP